MNYIACTSIKASQRIPRSFPESLTVGKYPSLYSVIWLLIKVTSNRSIIATSACDACLEFQHCKSYLTDFIAICKRDGIKHYGRILQFKLSGIPAH